MKVVSVNVGTPREFMLNGKSFRSAILKHAVQGRVPIRGHIVNGDEQADPSVHGGPDKAVYAYAAEDYAWWSEQLGRALEPGTFGDNLTTEGVAVNDALIGERWKVGTALLEVAGPRIPCFKLGARMEDPKFSRLFAEALRNGAYLRVVGEGDVAAGDTMEIVETPSHNVSVRLVARAYYEPEDLAGLILEAPQLPHGWRTWAEKVVRRRPSTT